MGIDRFFILLFVTATTYCLFTYAYNEHHHGCHNSTCEYIPGLLWNCSSSGLDHIPELPENTTCLDFHGNKLEVISKTVLQNLTNVGYIDFSSNIIQRVERDSFDNLTELEILFLNDNNLTLGHEHSFPNDLLKNLTELKILHLHGNKWNSNEYCTDLVKDLTNLDELRIEGLPNGKPVNLDLKSLNSSLLISGAFNYISNKTFSALQNSTFRTLGIVSSNLYDMEPGSFSLLTHLERLIIEDNIYLGLKNVSHGWFGLQFTKIKTLFIRRVVEWTTDAPPDDFKVSFDFYQYLDLTNITSFYFEENTISHMNFSFSKTLPNLMALSLACNNFVLGHTFLDDIKNLQNLTYLSLASQMTPFVTDGCPPTIWPKNIESASEGHTWTEHKDVKIACNDSEKSLDIPNNLAYVDLDRYFFQTTIPEVQICGGYCLQYIDSSGGNLHKLIGPLYLEHCASNLRVDLSYNLIDEISPDVLGENTSSGLLISEINLYDNKLGDQLSEDLNGTVFAAYRNLQKLNIGFNSIKYLKTGVFQNLQNLTHLNMSKNFLRDIPFNFTALQKLECLDLSYNLISEIDKETMDRIDEISQGKNFSLLLQGNPLFCVCENVQFLGWLQPYTNISEPVIKGQYNCTYNGKSIALKDFYSKEFDKFKIKCASLKLRTISIVAALGVLVTILLSVCWYRHRWEIKFFFISFVTKRKYYQQIQTNTHKYDAFLAYHEDALWWIKDHLLVNLEGGTSVNNSDGSYHLCLHHRDFLPGRAITENIIDAINESKWTILILTKGFVSSAWCDFELQMAKVRSFDEGQDLVIIVMLEKIAPGSMSKTLQGLVKTKTYIEWKSGIQGERNFWSKIKQVLGEPISDVDQHA